MGTLLKQSDKQRDIEIALAKRHVRGLVKMICRLMRGNWQPAPEDPGIKPGGIRDRAVKMLSQRTKAEIDQYAIR